MGDVYICARRNPASSMQVGEVIEDFNNQLFGKPYFLLCDGSSYPIAAFPELHAVLQNYYSFGNNDRTFNVPDLRVRVRDVDEEGYRRVEWWMR